MEESVRTGKFRKDPRQEDALRVLNERLVPLQQELEASFSTPLRAVIFIVGPPRSGSTLVSQILGATSRFAYISNFVARFWLAPAIGAQIESALGIRSELPTNPFTSEFGVTKGWASPHEFGYFWSHWFDRGQSTHKVEERDLADIDAEALQRRVAAIESVYELPLLFKNNTWCTFQAGWLARIFPRSIFVVCRRDPLFVAQSMLRARRERLGSVAAWWSMRPSSYRHLLKLAWHDQIAGQALEIEREMDEALREVPASRKIEVPYRSLCGDPRSFAATIGRAVYPDWCANDSEQIPLSFTHTDEQQIGDIEWDLLRKSIDRLRRDGVEI
jgi:hypothetical protein